MLLNGTLAITHHHRITNIYETYSGIERGGGFDPSDRVFVFVMNNWPGSKRVQLANTS